MAYSTANPPALVHQMVGKNGGSTWVYDSADLAAVVRVDGYITDAKDLGMAVGDIVHQRDTSSTVLAHDYTVIAIRANGSADLSDGTATPSLVNTD